VALVFFVSIPVVVIVAVHLRVGSAYSCAIWH